MVWPWLTRLLAGSGSRWRISPEGLLFHLSRRRGGWPGDCFIQKQTEITMKRHAWESTAIALALSIPLLFAACGEEDDDGATEEEGARNTYSAADYKKAVDQLKAEMRAQLSPATLKQTILGIVQKKTSISTFFSNAQTAAKKIPASLTSADAAMVNEVKALAMTWQTEIENAVDTFIKDSTSRGISADLKKFLEGIDPQLVEDLKQAGKIIAGIACIYIAIQLGIVAAGCESTLVGTLAAIAIGTVGIVLGFGGYIIMAPGIAYFLKKSSDPEIRNLGDKLQAATDYLVKSLKDLPKTIRWLRDGLSNFSMPDINEGLKHVPGLP
jgi:hypothetical protein